MGSMLSAKRFGLFKRMFVAYVLLVALAFGIEAWIVIVVAERTLREFVTEDLSERAGHRFEELETFVDDRAFEVRSWSELGSLDDDVTHGRVSAIQGFVIEQQRERSRQFAELTVLDRSETVIASTDRSALGASRPIVDLAPLTERDRKTRWSAVPADASEPSSVLRIAHPIRTPSGTAPDGWLVASVRWEAIEKILSNGSAASSATDRGPHFLLEDSSGRVMAGDQFLANVARGRDTLSGYLVAVHGLPERTVKPLDGFHVRAVWKSQEALGLRPRLVAVIIASAALQVLTAALIAFAVSSRIASRLRELTEGTRVVAAGDLSHRVEESPGDGFDELARAFNTMGRELAHARDHLEEALSRWKALLTHAPDVILAVDRQGKILFVNRVVSGLTVDAVIGTNIGDYTTPEYARSLLNAVDRVFHSGEAQSLDLQGRGPDDGIAWYSSHMGPVRRGDAIVAVTIVTSDITERKRLETEVLEIAESERARIGQDLHDGLGQSLSGLSLLSKVLERQMAETTPDQADRAKQLRVLIDETIGQVRSLARGLFPSSLEQLGLPKALVYMLESARDAHGIRYRIKSVEGASPSAPSEAIQLFRITQEAVNNAIRHGGARRIVVVLGRDEEGRFLAIRDDGVGLPADSARREGIGMRSMRHRASVLGGTLDVKAGRRGGTLVVCRFS
jgi:PAS domain S-box-containing protein